MLWHGDTGATAYGEGITLFAQGHFSVSPSRVLNWTNKTRGLS